MPDTLRCPDCGHENPADATSCEVCNFPLVREGGGASRPADDSKIVIPHDPSIPRPRRRTRARQMPNQSVTLWLVFGFLAAVVVLFVAIRSNVERGGEKVEGANEQQQQRANALEEALARDSSDVDAHVGLADVLFDTGNWSEAIVHYRAALRRDSSRVGALVDLGVCYYNLADHEEAERDFLLALARNPHQPIALFNMGILKERYGDQDQALHYFHQALQSDPPASMRQQVIEGIQRVQKATGKNPEPLNQGTP